MMSNYKDKTLLKDFYSVESSLKNEGKFIAEIIINKEHQLYQGHFPGRPVTPGVVLIQLFKEDLERQLKKSLQLKNLSNVKFMNVVDPLSHDTLVMEYTIEDNHNEISLKGVARTNNVICLRINAIYK